MQRYLIEEIGSSSSDEEEEHDLIKSDLSSRGVPGEDKSVLIQTLNHLSLPSDVPVNQTSCIPVKTVGENTANSQTTEDHNHVNKPASSNEHEADKNVSKALHHRPAISDADISLTPVPTINNGEKVKCQLTPPLTSIQFQTTWKRFEKNPEILCSYLKVCSECWI